MDSASSATQALRMPRQELNMHASCISEVYDASYILDHDSICCHTRVMQLVLPPIARKLLCSEHGYSYTFPRTCMQPDILLFLRKSYLPNKSMAIQVAFVVSFSAFYFSFPSLESDQFQTYLR